MEIERDEKDEYQMSIWDIYLFILGYFMPRQLQIHVNSQSTHNPITRRKLLQKNHNCKKDRNNCTVVSSGSFT